MTLFRRIGTPAPVRDPEMPPRPQSPHHRMPPEVAAQRRAEASGDDLPWSGAATCSSLRADEDPCGRPPMASGDAT